MDAWLRSDKEKIIENLGLNEEGQLYFGAAEIRLFKDFPNGTISISDLSYRSKNEKHKKDIARFEKIEAAFSLKEWFNNRLLIRECRLQNGTIEIHADQDGSHFFKGLGTGNGDGRKLDLDNMASQLDSIELCYTDSSRKKKFSGFIVSAELNKKSDDLNITLDLQVDELTFNSEKGGYLKNSQISGELELDTGKEVWKIAPAQLKINKEEFDFSASIDSQGGRSYIGLKNNKADIQTIRPLLTEALQNTLADYDIGGDCEINARIESTFKSGEQPEVSIDINSFQNDLVVKGRFFQHANMRGTFYNFLADEDLKNGSHDGAVKFVVHDLETRYEQFDISDAKGKVIYGKRLEDRLEFDAIISGSSESLGEWLNNDEFILQNGEFTLDASIRGPLESLDKIIEDSDGHLTMSQFNTVYASSGINIPIEDFYLHKTADYSQFGLKTQTPIDKEKIQLDGNITGISSLMTGSRLRNVKSQVSVTAGRVEWRDFLQIFDSPTSSANKAPDSAHKNESNKITLKETLKGLNDNFHPSFTIDVNELVYSDSLVLEKFHSEIDFSNSQNIRTDNSRFNVKEAEVTLEGDFDLSDPEITRFRITSEADRADLDEILPALNYFGIPLLETLQGHADDVDLQIDVKAMVHDSKGLIPDSATGLIHFEKSGTEEVQGDIRFKADGDVEMDIPMANKIEVAGQTKVFNDFFDNQDFIFEKGLFQAEFDFDRDVETFEQLLSESELAFAIQDAIVTYEPAEVSLPIADINVEMNDDRAVYDLLVRSDSLDRELRFEGEANNLSELIVGGTNKKFSSVVNVESPVFEWDLFTAILGGALVSDRTDSIVVDERNYKAMRLSLNGMMEKFNPQLTVDVDSFIYSQKLKFSDLSSAVRLDNQGRLLLDSTQINYLDGRIELSGIFDLRKDEVPFDFWLKTDQLDLGELLHSLDYLQKSSLEEAEHLDGILTMQLELAGVLDSLGENLMPDSTNAEVQFDLSELHISGLEIIDSLAEQFKNRDRFDNMYFAPIRNKVYIRGRQVEIPLMEVNSNAMDIFIHGDIGPELTDMWLTVPLSNLRRKYNASIVKNNGYARIRNKIHFQYSGVLPNERKFRMRFTKKKFYKLRGVKKQYKLDKKMYRKQRKIFRPT